MWQVTPGMGVELNVPATNCETSSLHITRSSLPSRNDLMAFAADPTNIRRIVDRERGWTVMKVFGDIVLTPGAIAAVPAGAFSIGATIY